MFLLILLSTVILLIVRNFPENLPLKLQLGRWTIHMRIFSTDASDTCSPRTKLAQTFLTAKPRRRMRLKHQSLKKRRGESSLSSGARVTSKNSARSPSGKYGKLGSQTAPASAASELLSPRYFVSSAGEVTTLEWQKAISRNLCNFSIVFLELTRIFQQISGSLLHSSWFLELSRNFFSKFSAVICTVVFFLELTRIFFFSRKFSAVFCTVVFFLNLPKIFQLSFSSLSHISHNCCKSSKTFSKYENFSDFFFLQFNNPFQFSNFWQFIIKKSFEKLLLILSFLKKNKETILKIFF